MARFVYQLFAEQWMSFAVESPEVPVFGFPELDGFEEVSNYCDNNQQASNKYCESDEKSMQTVECEKPNYQGNW